MPWFKVDDALHSHEKTIEAADSAVGREAMGLWAVAGSWAADNLTDGRVPLSVVKRLGWSRKHAERLVDLGFWEHADARAYQFHDWPDYQPTADAVLAKREARAAAGRAGGLASGRSRREAKASSKEEANASTTVEPPSRPVPFPTQDPSLRSGRAREAVPRETPPLAAAVELIASVTARTWDAQTWGDDLRWIASRPEHERRQVEASLRSDPWVEANPSKIHPGHVRKFWAKYAAPPDRGNTAPLSPEDRKAEAELAEIRRRAAQRKVAQHG